MIDKKAFRSISYGLYLITTHTSKRAVGCVVNTFAQVTSEPLQVSVTLNKENHTTQTLLESGRYIASCLSEEAAMELIGTFGFKRSFEVDKFEAFEVGRDEQGMPYVAEQVLARFSVNVTDSLDLGTHIMFIGTVEEAEVLAQGKPMTYAYYHEIKGGKTPSRASSYIAELEGDQPLEATGATPQWKCSICGHTEFIAELPEDYICPICGHNREKFVLV